MAAKYPRVRAKGDLTKPSMNTAFQRDNLSRCKGYISHFVLFVQQPKAGLQLAAVAQITGK